MTSSVVPALEQEPLRRFVSFRCYRPAGVNILMSMNY